jgi:Xaa-Pro aminopeptidase
LLSSDSSLPFFSVVTCSEPGYYEAGNFGIRIENLLVVVPKPEMKEFAGRGFLGFEKLTHIPIQKKLIDVSLLSKKEIEWIDQYHKEIREKVGPLLKTDRAKKYLAEATSPLC